MLTPALATYADAIGMQPSGLTRVLLVEPAGATWRLLSRVDRNSDAGASVTKKGFGAQSTAPVR